MWLTISLAVALAVALFFLFFGPRSSQPAAAHDDKLEAAKKAARKAEADAEKRLKELDEQRGALADLKEQLKAAKRKLFEQRESDKAAGQSRAQSDALRSLESQLEAARAEAAAHAHELQRLKAEAEIGRRRAPTPAPTPAPAPVVAAPPVPVPAAPAPAPAVAAPPRARELSPADNEKMERLEQNAKAERRRALELEREMLKMKRSIDSQNRLHAVTKGEAGLLKDKFKALEKRLNRVLLEDDLLRRALRALEEKTGLAAERTELTAEEGAASDRSVEELAAREERLLSQGDEGHPAEISPAEPPPAETARAHS